MAFHPIKKKKARLTPSRRSKVVFHEMNGQERVHHTSIQQFSNGERIVQQSIHDLDHPQMSRKPTLQPDLPITSPIEENVETMTPMDFSSPQKQHGASEYFEELEKYRDVYIHGFASRHAHPRLGEYCWKHPEVLATCRCITCSNEPLVCTTCIVTLHKTLPFHHLEKWNGQFFHSLSLKAAGAYLALGHDGELCPNRPARDFSDNIVVVNTTGVHDISLVYCHCVGRPSKLQQLFHARFWPATVKSPATVFTFSLLEHFHHSILVSRSSTLDFWQTLCRVTNSAFPEKVPDRYNQLLRCSRIYRVIKALEQSGQSSNIDHHLQTLRRPGLISMPCIACPEPGFNMPDDWEQTPENKSFIHRLFLHQDANFRNQLKTKTRRDVDDVPLFAGRCFYPPEHDFQEYLEKVVHHEEKSDCSNHKAVNLQHIVKFRHMQITGIMAVVCRHECFRPGGQNDLQKGERYANADYALAGALSWIPVPKEIVLTYDISCQYSKNIVPRFQSNFPELLPIVSSIKHAIPKKHIVGHKEECQIRWSCNYLPGFGRVHGEGVETIWAADNPQSTSLREMNAGHRQDVTDDNHLDWNYRKNQRLAKSTYEHFVAALDEYDEAALIFQAATTTVSPEIVSQWQEMNVLPYQNSKGEWESVYLIQRSKMPTQTQIYHSLYREEIREEMEQNQSSQCRRTIVELVQAGLQIQSTQYDLQHKITKSNTLSVSKDSKNRDQELLETGRHKLLRDVQRWTSDMCFYFPSFVDVLADLATEPIPEVEHIVIGLPSDLTSSQCQSLPGIEEMARAELLLRQGQANDALAKLCEQLRLESCLRRQKKEHVFGQGPTTRANQRLITSGQKKNRSADMYILARQAIIDLGGFEHEEELADRYLELNKVQDIRMKDPTKLLTLGESRQQDSWIWQFGEENTNVDSPEWQIETDRVRWFKTRAALERWREELLLRDADFDRIRRGYTRLAEAFTALANGLHEPGLRALSFHTAADYKERSVECHILHQKALTLLSNHSINLDKPIGHCSNGST